mmetsp:Transcript_22154/g.39274  ORF Transcript_22154/g.39274 Transcript_22154/m.39274 type:complete len:190 (-) Transcript_22154:451-1020(-)
MQAIGGTGFGGGERKGLGEAKTYAESAVFRGIGRAPETKSREELEADWRRMRMRGAPTAAPLSEWHKIYNNIQARESPNFLANSSISGVKLPEGFPAPLRAAYGGAGTSGQPAPRSVRAAVVTDLYSHSSLACDMSVAGELVEGVVKRRQTKHTVQFSKDGIEDEEWREVSAVLRELETAYSLENLLHK